MTPYTYVSAVTDLYVGCEFDTAEDAICFVNEFSAANFHPLRQRSTETITNYNKKVGMVCTQVSLQLYVSNRAGIATNCC